MSVAKLDTGFNIEVKFNLATFFKRFVAWVIDLMICWLYVYLVDSIFIYNNEYGLKVLFVSLPVLFYHLGFEWLNNGKSPGKILMGIKVISADGGQPTFSQYLIRWSFRLVDFPFIILMLILLGQLPWYTFVFSLLGFLSVVFTSRSQRLGDLAAGTMVINNHQQSSWEDTVFVEIEENYTPSYPQVMKLSDRDINTLKSFIQVIEKNNDDDLAARIADKIRQNLNIDNDRDNYEFLVKLLKDYNYYTQTD